jgi:hypothetical protein
MGERELGFVVFCIESVAERLGIDGREVYNLLTKRTKILDDYVIPCFDVLHTQGKEYLVNDILGRMREEGLQC